MYPLRLDPNDFAALMVSSPFRNPARQDNGRFIRTFSLIAEEAPMYSMIVYVITQRLSHHPPRHPSRASHLSKANLTTTPSPYCISQAACTGISTNPSPSNSLSTPSSSPSKSCTSSLLFFLTHHRLVVTIIHQSVPTKAQPSQEVPIFVACLASPLQFRPEDLR